MFFLASDWSAEGYINELIEICYRFYGNSFFTNTTVADKNACRTMWFSEKRAEDTIWVSLVT